MLHHAVLKHNYLYAIANAERGYVGRTPSMPPLPSSPNKIHKKRKKECILFMFCSCLKNGDELYILLHILKVCRTLYFSVTIENEQFFI